MTRPTTADMAREIERRRPGSLPKSLTIAERAIWLSGSGGYDDVIIDDHAAAAILRDAMVMAIGAARTNNSWTITVQLCQAINGTFSTFAIFFDRDHCGDPTRSLYAAFLAETEGGAK